MFLRVIAFEENKWIKTQKGYELYIKVMGLKNYIKDYSMLSDSELKEITLWEDYLIYAIILNNTSQLNKEAKEYYKKICDIQNEKYKINQKNKKYAILSIIIPIISFIIWWNNEVTFLLAIMLTVLGICFAKKGEIYSKKLAEIGYVLNIICLIMGVLIIFGLLIYI